MNPTTAMTLELKVQQSFRDLLSIRTDQFFDTVINDSNKVYCEYARIINHALCGRVDWDSIPTQEESFIIGLYNWLQTCIRDAPHTAKQQIQHIITSLPAVDATCD